MYEFEEEKNMYYQNLSENIMEVTKAMVETNQEKVNIVLNPTSVKELTYANAYVNFVNLINKIAKSKQEGEIKELDYSSSILVEYFIASFTFNYTKLLLEDDISRRAQMAYELALGEQSKMIEYALKQLGYSKIAIKLSNIKKMAPNIALNTIINEFSYDVENFDKLANLVCELENIYTQNLINKEDNTLQLSR